MVLKLNLWQKILYYHNQYGHLPLIRFAMKLKTPPSYFNKYLEAMQLNGFCLLVCPDGRSKRMVLTQKGLLVANNIHNIALVVGFSSDGKK